MARKQKVHQTPPRVSMSKVDSVTETAAPGEGK